METSSSVKEQRDYAWNYFQLHAAQRMATFNFFIVIATLLSTGIAGTFLKEVKWNIVGTVLSLGLIVVSFVFWKLDQRVRFLIKHAETYLKTIEHQWKSEIVRDGGFFGDIFSEEEMKTQKEKENKGCKFWLRHMSYSECFNIVYCLFGIFGLLAAVGSFLK